MGNSSKDVVAKVHHLRDALETNGNPFTVVDAKVLLPMGKPSINIGNPSCSCLEIQSPALDVSTLWLLNEECKSPVLRRRVLSGPLPILDQSEERTK